MRRCVIGICFVRSGGGSSNAIFTSEKGQNSHHCWGDGWSVLSRLRRVGRLNDRFLWLCEAARNERGYRALALTSPSNLRRTRTEGHFGRIDVSVHAFLKVFA